MMNSILGINLFQNFAIILVWKINRWMNKYNESKNQGLIMLIMKFEGHNN